MIIVTLDTFPSQKIYSGSWNVVTSTVLLVHRWPIQLESSERTTFECKKVILHLLSPHVTMVRHGADLSHLIFLEMVAGFGYS